MALGVIDRAIEAHGGVGVSAISHLSLHRRTQEHGDSLTDLMKCNEPKMLSWDFYKKMLIRSFCRIRQSRKDVYA
jgi:hypothetical protein